MPTVSQLKKLIKDLDPKARVFGPRKDELERIYKCLQDGGRVKEVYKEVKSEVKTNSLLHELTVPQLRIAIKEIDFEATVWNMVRSQLEDKLTDLRLWRQHVSKLPDPRILEYGEKYQPRTTSYEIKLIKIMLNMTDSEEEDSDDDDDDYEEDIKQIKLWFKLAVMGEFKTRVKSMGGKNQLMRECKLDTTEEQNEKYINREVARQLRFI